MGQGLRGTEGHESSVGWESRMTGSSRGHNLSIRVSPPTFKTTILWAVIHAAATAPGTGGLASGGRGIGGELEGRDQAIALAELHGPRRVSFTEGRSQRS